MTTYFCILLCICYCFSHLIGLLSVKWLSLLYKFTRFFIYFLFLSDEGPMLETLYIYIYIYILYIYIYCIYIYIYSLLNPGQLCVTGETIWNFVFVGCEIKVYFSVIKNCEFNRMFKITPNFRSTRFPPHASSKMGNANPNFA